jgi:hypothetical protein
MAEAKDGCVKPAKGVIGLAETKTSQTTEIQKEGLKMNAKVGQTGARFYDQGVP